MTLTMRLPHWSPIRSPITHPRQSMRPPSTQRTATQPVFPFHFTFTQSLPEGPPDQQLYEPPLLLRVHGVVVQGILELGSVMV